MAALRMPIFADLFQSVAMTLVVYSLKIQSTLQALDVARNGTERCMLSIACESMVAS